MKTLKIVIIITIALSITSCSRIKEDNSVLMKDVNDSLLVINIPSASCGNCQKVIEEGLQNVRGVKQSLLNLNTKNVSVVYNPNMASSELITKAVTQLIYKIPCK